MPEFILSAMRWNPQAKRELTYLIHSRNPTVEQVAKIIQEAEAIASKEHSLVTQAIIYKVSARVLGAQKHGG